MITIQFKHIQGSIRTLGNMNSEHRWNIETEHGWNIETTGDLLNFLSSDVFNQHFRITPTFCQAVSQLISRIYPT